MTVVWARVFLDLPEDGFDEQVEFWRQVTALDIPADRYAAELAFWAALTGWLPPRAEPDGSGLLPLTRPVDIPLRLLTRRLGEPDGVVTAHVDLACEDRAARTQEHLELGAEVESVHEGWTVLRAPGGARYCLTERDPRTGLRT